VSSRACALVRMTMMHIRVVRMSVRHRPVMVRMTMLALLIHDLFRRVPMPVVFIVNMVVLVFQLNMRMHVTMVLRQM